MTEKQIYALTLLDQWLDWVYPMDKHNYRDMNVNACLLFESLQHTIITLPSDQKVDEFIKNLTVKRIVL